MLFCQFRGNVPTNTFLQEELPAGWQVALVLDELQAEGEPHQDIDVNVD